MFNMYKFLSIVEIFLIILSLILCSGAFGIFLKAPHFHRNLIGLIINMFISYVLEAFSRIIQLSIYFNDPMECSKLLG
jgi:hypothetical protein